jgi:uncharacterized OsmC-like protein
MQPTTKVKGSEAMNRSNRIEVRHEGGDRFAVQIRQHEITVDQPLLAGGTDAAPTPTELFVGAYSACVAFYARRFLHRHGLPETVTVRTAWRSESKPHRVGSIGFRIAASVPVELRGRFMSVIRGCTVGNTLMHPPDIRFELDDRPAVPREERKAG